MGSDSKGEEKPVVEKWKKGERMIDGHSGVAECGATERQRWWRAFFFFFSPYGLRFCSSAAPPPPAADPSCHLMPAKHEINRHSWHKQAREQIHSHVRAERVELLDGEACR